MERECGAAHPGMLGFGKGMPNVYFDNGGGIGTDLPPIPVYRKYTWCMGHWTPGFAHPRIFMKCPKGQVIHCKWCRMKFINMSAEGDCDDDWEEEEHAIAVTPEKMEDILKPRRDLSGQIRYETIQDGKTPHPEVFKSVYNPEKYKWRQVDETGKLMPPKKQPKADAAK